MGALRTLAALVLVVVAALALPAAASAIVRVAVVTDQRSGERHFQVADGLGNGAIRLVQENQPNTPAIAIFIPADDAVQLGAGCRTLSGPPRARCDTGGVAQIVVNLAEGTRPETIPNDINSIDLTGVSQLTPDGSEPLPTRLTGGPGADTVTDGAGRLRASMLGGNDIVEAGAGNDDIDDGQGNDIVLAGEGNDRFGDFHTPGSDILSGGPGSDQVIARGVVTLNDLLCNDGASADSPASPLVQRSVSAPEGTLECPATGAARDLIAGVEAVGQTFGDSVDFTGSDADETLSGQDGSDRLDGGGGLDTLLGFEGNDLLLGRDQLADARVDCGEGGGDDDRAVVDQADPVDPNCETIERGSAGVVGPVVGVGDIPSNGNEGPGPGGGDNGQTPPEVEIPDRVAFIRRRRIQIRVRCVYRAQNCAGRMTLTAAQTRRAGRLRVRRGRRLARGSVTVPWGTSEPTTLRAPRSLARVLRRVRGRTLRVRVLVQVRDSAAPASAPLARASRRVTLGFQK
jgi:hypothetical protein